MRLKKILGVGLVAALVLVGAQATFVKSGDPYEVRLLMASADGTFDGGKVLLGGKTIGHITDIGVVDKKAVITATIDKDYAPLHAGTDARINWESVVGGRAVEILPGSKENPALASGQTIVSSYERVELDQILEMLDAPTRGKVQGLVARLDETLSSSDKDINSTLNAAGPTIKTLSEVMRGVGQDGPAIKALVSRLQDMTRVLANKDNDVSATIAHLHRLTTELASRQNSIQQTLEELPSTVSEARVTLDKVPRAVDATIPMLDALRPATKQLPETAHNLSPVLQDLRPTVASLRPALDSAQVLLQSTPSLLDSTHATLPDVTTAFTTLHPAVSYLRPYTPELTGWLTNWTSLFASQTSGNYARLLIPEGATSVVGVHPSLPPGTTMDAEPDPGSIAGQPWVDANGDEVR